MSLRRKSPNKVTLGMIKGKSASASISNIAIRFHADDEELEQVVQSNDDGGKDETAFKQDMVDDESFSLSSSQLSTPTSTQSDLTSSSSSSCVLSRLGKRSTSLESASASSGPDTSSGDAWRLFREVRGRITKTVEEKIEEIKSDRLKNNKNKQKNSKLGTKVDSSSVSDSEDQSESSSSIKVNDSSNVSNNNSSTEQKDCDNQVKKNDNQIQNDSGRSTPIINSGGGGSSSDKDELTNSTVSNSSQKDKSDEDSKKSKNDQPDCKNGKDKKKEKHASFVIDDKKPTEEKKKDKTDEDGHTKKEKKSRRFHFRERFHGSPDKKKQEISIKFSSLKDEEESDDEKECIPVEFGLEASELVNIVEPVKETFKKLSPSSSFSLSSPCTPTYFAKLSNLLWNWRYAVIAAILAIAHYVWPFHYMLGFFVGVLLTLQVMIAVNWAHDVFNLRELPSHGLDYTEENSPYSGFVYPIFASSHYFSPQDNPEQITYEGWLNEFSQEYSPDLYHISLTDTVHVKLKGSTLTISNPSTKIPKRASWNEPEHKKLYNRQRLFDIAGCKIQLLPVGLTHKRIWSKKYPICITLLKISKLGVRYRCKGKITIENDQPWLDPEVEVKTPIESNENQEIFPMDPIDQSSLEEKFDDKTLEGDKPQVKETVINSEESPLKEKNKLVNNDSIIEDDDDDEDFVRISPSLLNEFCIYLFARCDRQKEIWFRRLVAAAGYQSFTPPEKETSEILEVENNAEEKDKDKQQQQPKTAEIFDERQEITTPASIRYENEKEYLNYMNRLSQKKVPKLPSKEKESNTKHANVSKQSASSPTNSVPPQTDDMYDVCEEVMWVNAFGGRLLYDVLRDSFWLSKIQEKFQRKLSAIKLPYFMEELVISHIDFGQTVPIVQGTSRPVLNEDGVWVDLSVIYEGHFRLTIDTKLNLMKLKKAQASLDDSDASLLDSSTSNLSVMCSSASTDTLQVTPPSSYNASIQKSAIFDSDVEDSAESSSEELDITKTGPITLPDLTPSSPGSSTSHKMLRMVDKIAASKYFQQVTDYKYIKRAMEGVSNTNIALEVEVRGLAGTLVLNFPPPPSDRLWYGFRPNLNLQLSAQPKVGDRTITLLHISTWIERRLRREFQKLLVLPNMDDLIIPVMNKEQPS